MNTWPITILNKTCYPYMEMKNMLSTTSQSFCALDINKLGLDDGYRNNTHIFSRLKT